MLFSEIRQRLNLNIIESTLSSDNFVGINIFVISSTMSTDVLYCSLEDTVIDDDVHSFLFINHLPRGNYKKYALIRTEENPLHIISKIQELFIANLNHSNDLLKLATLGNSDNSLEDLIKMAAGIVNNPFVLCNTAYEMIYVCDNNQDVDDYFFSKYIKQGHITNDLIHFYEKNGITKKVRTRDEPILWNYDVSSDISNAHSILTQRVMGPKGVIGYLSCLLITENSLTISIEITKQLSEMLSKRLTDSSAHTNTKLQIRKLFFNKLINGEIVDSVIVNTQLKEMDYRSDKYFRLVIVTSENDSPIYNMDYYLNLVSTPHIMGTTYNGNLILLITYDNDFKKLIRFIDESFNTTQFRYLISMEYENIMHSEKIMKTMNAHYPLKKKFTYLEDFLLLQHVPASYLYNSTYEMLLNNQNGGELIKTLVTYIESNMNITDCAKALFIHRNTTMHRLERIRIEGNIDMDNYLELMNFYIYYCVKNNLL